MDLATDDCAGHAASLAGRSSCCLILGPEVHLKHNTIGTVGWVTLDDLEHNFIRYIV